MFGVIKPVYVLNLMQESGLGWNEKAMALKQFIILFIFCDASMQSTTLLRTNRHHNLPAPSSIPKLTQINTLPRTEVQAMASNWNTHGRTC